MFTKTRQLFGLGSESRTAEQLTAARAGERDVLISADQSEIRQRVAVDRDPQGFACITTEPKQIRAAGDDGLRTYRESGAILERGHRMQCLPELSRHRHSCLVAGNAQRDLALGGDAFGTVVLFERRELALVDRDRAV